MYYLWGMGLNSLLTKIAGINEKSPNHVKKDWSKLSIFWKALQIVSSPLGGKPSQCVEESKVGVLLDAVGSFFVFVATPTLFLLLIVELYRLSMLL